MSLYLPQSIYPFVDPSCPLVRQIKEATVTTLDVSVRSIVIYKCNRGYRFPDGTNHQAIECLTNYLWNHTVPDCEGIVEYNLSLCALYFIPYIEIKTILN